jgi:hypothetical protein
VAPERLRPRILADRSLIAQVCSFGSPPKRGDRAGLCLAGADSDSGPGYDSWMERVAFSPAISCFESAESPPLNTRRRLAVMKGLPVPKKPRCWFRYSLRTLLLLITLLCFWIGWQVNRAQRQKQTVASIRAVGGLVHYEHERLEGEDGVPDLPERPLPGPDWLHELLGVDYFASVEYVMLEEDVPENVLKGLAHLKGLKYLDFNGSGTLNDEDLSYIARVHSIEGLTLDGKNLTSRGLDSLKSMKQLRQLSINHKALTTTRLAELMRELPDCDFSCDSASSDDE